MTLILLLAAIATAATPVDEAQIQGSWDIVRYTTEDGVAGRENFASPERMRVTFAGGVYLVNGQARATYVLRPGREPRAIELHLTAGNFRGKTHWELYRLEGDTLTICASNTPEVPPREFAARPGSGLALYTYSRVKEPDPDVDRLKLQGAWSLSLHMGNGTVVYDARRPGEPEAPRLVFDGVKVSWFGGNRRETFTLHPERNPKVIEFQGTDGRGNPYTHPMAYRIKDGTLELCVNAETHEPAGEFSSEPGSNRLLMVFRRPPATDSH